MNQLIIFALVAISHVMSQIAMGLYNGSMTCEDSALTWISMSIESFEWDKCWSPESGMGSSINSCNQDGIVSKELYRQGGK